VSFRVQIISKKDKVKCIAIPVTDRGGPVGFEMLRIPHCLDNRLTVNCEILATCSSTYSPVRTSQEHTPSPYSKAIPVTGVGGLGL
jgi:hypothetical protein